MKTVNLLELINPHAKQLEYLQAANTYKYVLFGGARGGGKSYIERWRHVIFLLSLTAKGFRNKRSAIFSQTFKEVRDRQFNPAKNEFPDWLGTFNETLLEFRFFPEYGGHTICFCNLEKLEAYQSQEFATIGIEEVTLIPNWETIAILGGSVRCPGLEHTPICATCNPGGLGTSWVKGLWVYKTLFHHPEYERLNPDKFYFIQSLPTDNPHQTTDYIEYLNSLPEYKRKLWLEGSWDVQEGNRFDFNPNVHVVEPFELKGPVHYFAAMDYGFNNPFAFGLYATLPISNETYIYKIAEINISGLSAEEQADSVIQLLERRDITLKNPIYLDPSCWKHTDEGLSIADKLRKKGLKVQEAHNDRSTGWDYLEDLLHYKNDEHGNVIKQPRMKIFKNCKQSIQQITDAMWDPKRDGDILHPESFRDDSLDETRYFALTHNNKPRDIEPHDEFKWMKEVSKRYKVY
jgi:phage terminase large subunit